MKQVSRPVEVYQTEHRPLYFGCAATFMSALQYYHPLLADETAYYASLMHWSFFFDRERGLPLGIPADELMHRNLSYLYGITRKEVRRESFAALWQTIEELIDRDRVAVAWVDAHQVDDRAFHYNRLPGAAELMVIYGFDHERDRLGIVVTPQHFKGCMPLSRLSDTLADYFVYDYEGPEDLVLWPAAKALRLLQRDVLEMVKGRKMQSVETGFSAIEGFIEEMRRRAGQSESELSAWMKAVFEQMTLVGPQRRYLGYTFQRLSQHHGHCTLAGSARAFLAAGQGWEVARNLFFKGSKRDALSLLPRIRKRIETILVQEREQACFLQDWLTRSI